MSDRLHSLAYLLIARPFVQIAVWLTARRDFRGLQNVPRKGPFIMTSNHMNNADPPVLTALMPRRIVWMAKQELFDAPVLGWLCRLFGLIPVRRFEADLSALRRSQQALKRGHAVGMFPEGTRSAGGGLKEGEPGTAVIALRAGVPVLPVAIWGTEHVKLPRDIFRRTRVSVRIGTPYRLPETKRVTKEQVAAATEEIMRRIAELLPPEHRGVYAGAGGETPAAAALESEA